MKTIESRIGIWVNRGNLPKRKKNLTICSTHLTKSWLLIMPNRSKNPLFPCKLQTFLALDIWIGPILLCFSALGFHPRRGKSLTPSNMWITRRIKTWLTWKIHSPIMTSSSPGQTGKEALTKTKTRTRRKSSLSSRKESLTWMLK